MSFENRRRERGKELREREGQMASGASGGAGQKQNSVVQPWSSTAGTTSQSNMINQKTNAISAPDAENMSALKI